ncbi:uncharacterized protein [Argopecten irradians]|uniref:uncharacterized protein n=1 Tax=Argopecten irradians TaxID=31199 RepID=UPI0037231371
MSYLIGSSVILVFTLIFVTGIVSWKPCPERCFDKIDIDQSGFLDMNEFKKCFTDTEEKNIDKETFLNATASLNFDPCGIDPSFLFETLAKKRVKIHLENIFHAAYDTDDDEKISLSEFQREHYKIFVKWMNTKFSSNGFLVN